YIDNDGDALPEITYEFRFEPKLLDPDTFLYNTGPITSLGDSHWNKRQVYSVTRIDNTTKSRGRAAKAGGKHVSAHGHGHPHEHGPGHPHEHGHGHEHGGGRGHGRGPKHKTQTLATGLAC